MSDTYIVQSGRIAWHSKEKKNYKEGETINLSHLNDEQIAALLANGVIVKKAEAAKTKEVKNG